LYRLREAYDLSFRRLCLAVHTQSGIAEAEREYQACRDSLAIFLLRTIRLRRRRLAVEKLAYALWEQAGYPRGTDLSDWFRAEAMLSQSAALTGTFLRAA
jgi:hypothetical protein